MCTFHWDFTSDIELSGTNILCLLTVVHNSYSQTFFVQTASRLAAAINEHAGYN